MQHVNGTQFDIAPPMVMCVPPALVDQVWPLVRDMLDRGYANSDELMPEDLCEQMAKGDPLLWIAQVDERIVAAMTTALVKKRSGLVLLVISVGGSDLAVWKKWQPHLEKYARDEGCFKICGAGRRGWCRVLDGFRVTSVSFEKRM